MSFNAEDLQEENIEPDFDPGYPYGGSVEPYDIERDNQGEQDGYECDYCGSTSPDFHACNCGAELTKKQCEEFGGLCRTCLRMM